MLVMGVLSSILFITALVLEYEVYEYDYYGGGSIGGGEAMGLASVSCN